MNRQKEEDARALRRMNSDPLRPRAVQKLGAPVKAGELKGMKESNRERVATYTGPEPCASVRKDDGEASVGDHAGWPLSRENCTLLRKQWALRGADAVEFGGRQHRAWRYREARSNPARSENPRTHGINSHGNREILRSSAVESAADRIAKPQGTRR